MKKPPNQSHCLFGDAVQAVLFDMDGVIVDSMPYHFISWVEALAPYGVRVDFWEIFRREGERWDKSVRFFFRRAGKNLPMELLPKIFRRRQRIFKRYYRRILFSGATEVLLQVKRRGYLLGLVTGTPLPDVRHILPPAVFRLFDTVVTGDMVRHGKPHPEPYRTAARRLSVPAGQCLVVENAPLGIAAAKAARMRVCAVATSLPRDYLPAEVVVDDLGRLLALLPGARRSGKTIAAAKIRKR